MDLILSLQAQREAAQAAEETALAKEIAALPTPSGAPCHLPRIRNTLNILVGLLGVHFFACCKI